MGSVSHIINNLTGRTQSQAADRAARQAAAAQQQLQQNMMPYTQAGSAFAGQMTDYLNPGGTLGPGLPYNTSPPSSFNVNLASAPKGYNNIQDFKFDQNDPSYQWIRQQSIDAARAGAAGAGNFGSGNMFSGIEDRASNLASTEYNNAFNRWAQQQQLGMQNQGQNWNEWAGGQNLGLAGQNQAFNQWGNTQQLGMNAQNAFYNRLYPMISLGENAAAGVGNAGLNTAANQGNAWLSGANALNQGTTGLVNNINPSGVASGLGGLWDVGSSAFGALSFPALI